MFHASLISLYVIYLTWTAIESAPRKYQEPLPGFTGMRSPSDNFRTYVFQQEYYCGPNYNERTWTDDFLPYISVGLMFIMVIYASIRSSGPENCQALEFPNCPVSYTTKDVIVEDIGGQRIRRNER